MATDVGEACEVVTGEEELECFVHEGRKGGESAEEAGDEKSCGGGRGTKFCKEDTEKSDYQRSKAVDEPRAIGKSGTYGAGNKNGHAVAAKTTKSAAEGDEEREGVVGHN